MVLCCASVQANPFTPPRGRRRSSRLKIVSPGTRTIVLIYMGHHVTGTTSLSIEEL
jgi:hypothetical protein